MHLLVRIDMEPGKPDLYIGICGYQSTTKKEFTLDLSKTKCEECHAKTDHS